MQVGVRRSTGHRCVGRYATAQLGGVADRSHRPASRPDRVLAWVEVFVAAIRRQHRAAGAGRAWLETLRMPLLVSDASPRPRPRVRLSI